MNDLNDLNEKNIIHPEFFSAWTRLIPESEIRRLLKYNVKYYYAGGKPGALPIKTFSEILTNIVHEHLEDIEKGNYDIPLDDYNYGQTGGKPFLKKVLAKRIREREGIELDKETGWERITITSGSQQAIYAILDSTIEPGDFIITPRPAYLGFLGPAVKFGANLLTVPTDLEGLIPECIEDAIQACIKKFHRTPKMLYVVCYSDNPKGTTISQKRMKQLYDIAEQYNILIIDDEAYKEIQFTDKPIRTIKSLDKENKRVVYLSTSSKEAAVFRIGYSIMPEIIEEQVIKAKGYLDLCTPTLTQKILAIYYKDYIDKVLPETNRIYKARRDAMLKGIEESFPAGEFTKPTGGFFIWWQSDNPNFNSSKFMEEVALKNELIYVPSSAFYPVCGYAFKDGNIIDNIIEYDAMRLSFSFKDAENIKEGIPKLGKLLTENIK